MGWAFYGMSFVAYWRLSSIRLLYKEISLASTYKLSAGKVLKAPKVSLKSWWWTWSNILRYNFLAEHYPTFHMGHTIGILPHNFQEYIKVIGCDRRGVFACWSLAVAFTRIIADSGTKYFRHHFLNLFKFLFVTLSWMAHNFLFWVYPVHCASGRAHISVILKPACLQGMYFP